MPLGARTVDFSIRKLKREIEAFDIFSNFSGSKLHGMRYLAMRDARRPLCFRTVDFHPEQQRGFSGQIWQEFSYCRALMVLNIVRSKISSARAFRSSAICRASSSVIQVKSSFFTLKMTTLFTIGTPWSSHP